MKAKTVALRDQIRAILRDSGVMPMSTQQVADAVGKIRHVEPVRIRQIPNLTYLGWELIEEPVIDGAFVYLRPCLGMDVYPQLDAMAKRGQVERIRVDGFRSAYWRLLVSNR